MFDMDSEQQKANKGAVFRLVQWAFAGRRHQRCQHRQRQHSHVGKNQQRKAQHPRNIAGKSAGRKLMLTVPIERERESRSPKGQAQDATAAGEFPG
jgi:hypothetical protein